MKRWIIRIRWLRQVSGHIEERFPAKVIKNRYGISVLDFLKIILSGIVLLFLTAYIFYHNFYAVIFLCPYLHFRLKTQSAEIQKRKKDQLNMQFKDGMQSVSFSLNSGYSIENAFKEACVELKFLYGEESMIVKEFQRIVSRLERNQNIEDVLEDFAVRSEVEDIQYFAAVFRYAKRYGGDLIAIIHQTARTIREKNETRSEIQTVISGKKMEQKVMSAVPFLLMGYLKVTAWEFVSPLYGNLPGAAVMTGCLLLYVLSDYIAKRIVDIEV